MSGPVLAAIAGVGFGAFQTLNRRAVGGMSDAYLATFLQLVVALAVLVTATALSGDARSALESATARAVVLFALAGLVHFLVGWTLLNLSQMRIGAARTSPLLATNPVWGAAIAGVTIRELPRLVSWLGIGLVVAGAFVVSLERVAETGWGIPWRDAAPGLATAVAWATSPVLIKEGLEGLDSPLVGLTLGMAVALAAYALLLPLRPRPVHPLPLRWDAFSFKLAAGLLVGLSVWARWEALELADVAVVLALGLMSVPVVLLLSPLLMGRHVERVGVQLWLGATLVVAGSLVLVVAA
ncbi:MAG TPA: DMT family transporter [Gaiellaceae bacterium]|nr:DMT family transporter [Gaiellaceae bacterium]